MRAPFAIVALTSACLAAARTAGAAEWSAAPTVAWSVDHTSNRVMREGGDPSEGGYLGLDLLLKRATPSSALMLRPHVTFQRYTGDSVSDSDDRSLQAGGLWRTPRSLFSAQASIAQQNTLNTALVDAELVGLDTRRRSKLASFTWTHDQTKDRHQLMMGLNYLDVDYQGNDAYQLSGYRYPSASITQSIGWSPRSSIQLTASGSRLDSDSKTRSDSVGAQVGFAYDITSRINLSLSGGYSRQKIEQPFFFGLFMITTKDSGYTGDFQLTRRDPLGEWHLTAGRSVTPSGFGALVLRTEAGLGFNRRIAPRWTTSMSLRHFGNDDIGDISAGEVHSGQRIDASLGWQASRTWTLNAGTFWNRLERTLDAPVTRGWGATLSATWVPNPRLISR